MDPKRTGDGPETDRRWTPERIAAMRRVVEAARRFVRCADEFFPEYPAALSEEFQALESAIDAETRAWDDARPPCPDCPGDEPASRDPGHAIRCGSCERPVRFVGPDAPPIAWGGEADGW